MDHRSWLLRMALAAFLLSCASPVGAQAVADSTRLFVMPLRSEVFANTRSLRVYVPPGYSAPENAETRYPLLIMGDGFAVFSPGAWNAPAVVDSLVGLGRVAPVILVGVDNAASIPGTSDPGFARANEYLPFPDSLQPDVPDPQGHRYPQFIETEVLPLIRSRFRIDDSSDRVAIGGSSLSAIAALHTATQLGGRFGGVLLESPPVFMFRERLTAEFEEGSTPPQRLYVGIGTSETPDTTILRLGDEAIERLVAAARHKGTITRLNRVSGATHDSRSWRSRLPAALTFLFPPGSQR